ncbi:F-box/LRR-repeat protein At3g48880-like isoform X2 [Daucus carota subsp. sativus]|uniref:F-box/LRR-repeat protein At3g48880-like isoform X2 n=1 Tax=Daucus carota subsp. sativus TaxID=79200 RepID=UPI0007F0393B|nr:PREDICTED: F-box/LRR-repeat protein At3g48880-like isoform X1 [Daucus carota subsp. sativus]
MDRDRRHRKRKRRGARFKTTNAGAVPRSAEMAVDRWLDLPSGPLGQIFSKLNPIDAILVIPLVCKYWGQIFLKQVFRIQENSTDLDLTRLCSTPLYSLFHLSGNENVRAKRLMTVIVGFLHAFASGSENDAHNSTAARPTLITDLDTGAALSIHDRHLVYIAQRCPDLRSLLLPCVKNITRKGISRALQCWSGMEMLMVRGPLNNLPLPVIIEEIGVNCKNLKSIHLTYFKFQRQSAELIVSNLKSLERLGLRHVKISKYALHSFLSRLKKPMLLYLDSCFYTNNEDRGEQACFKIWNIQIGCRIKWRTNICSYKVEELYTSKGLTDLIWKLKN